MGFVVLFLVCVGGCYLFFKMIALALFPKSNDDRFYFIDKSVNHHYHDNRSVHIDSTPDKKSHLDK